MKQKYKDPLAIDFKETTKTLVKGAVVIGIGIPIVLGLTKLVGGNNNGQ